VVAVSKCLGIVLYLCGPAVVVRRFRSSLFRGRGVRDACGVCRGSNVSYPLAFFLMLKRNHLLWKYLVRWGVLRWWCVVMVGGQRGAEGCMVVLSCVIQRRWDGYQRQVVYVAAMIACACYVGRGCGAWFRGVLSTTVLSFEYLRRTLYTTSWYTAPRVSSVTRERFEYVCR
jgi:hypothetical protein